MKLPSLLAHTSLTSEQVGLLQGMFCDFLRWLQKNSSSLFKRSNYQKATAEYVARFVSLPKDVTATVTATATGVVSGAKRAAEKSSTAARKKARA